MAMETQVITGSFLSTGAAQAVYCPFKPGWIDTYNITEAITPVASNAVRSYWQIGMANGGGMFDAYNTGTTAVTVGSYTAPAGFTLLTLPGTPGVLFSSVTAISTATPPVVSATSHGLSTGNVVRILNVTGALQLGGLDFTITRTSANAFSLPFGPTLGVAGTSGSYIPISTLSAPQLGVGQTIVSTFDRIFFPRWRYITDITSATQAVITLSVTHGFTVGQLVRVIVPFQLSSTNSNIWTWTQSQIAALSFNPVEIVAITQSATVNTITVNFDTSSFGTFSFPTSAQAPFTCAQVIPVGEGTDATIASPNLLDDATVNVAQNGFSLASAATGTASPAGLVGETIFYKIGASSNQS
jgi:hypothetical protein